MPNRIFNHRRLIKEAQPGLVKVMYPGMFVKFKYRKKRSVLDQNPILLVLQRDYKNDLMHGININYLSVYQLNDLVKNLYKGTRSGELNKIITEDQKTKYDDMLPYRNLLKQPYTRLKLPVFKEVRKGKAGDKVLSESQARNESKMIYNQIIKRQMKTKNLDIYRTYKINLMSSMKVLLLNIKS